MQVAELIRWFEDWCHPVWQENWDNCGWQVEPGVLHQTAHVLVCLTPTLAVMREALALRQQGVGVNLIFAHHPLIFSPLKSLQMGRAVSEVIKLALLNEIGIYTAHTNFDQVNQGVADVLAQKFNLQHPQPMVTTGDDRGYGRSGLLPSPLPLGQLLLHIKTVLQVSDLLISPEADAHQVIQRVAVLGGSGANFLSDVVRNQAQIYITGDCKFHQFQEARDRGFVLVDAGHYATERPACAHLAEQFRHLNLPWVALSLQDEDFRQFTLGFHLNQFERGVHRTI